MPEPAKGSRLKLWLSAAAWNGRSPAQGRHPGQVFPFQISQRYIPRQFYQCDGGVLDQERIVFSKVAGDDPNDRSYGQAYKSPAH
ncbi:MAG TPA: hypothetical protein VH678_17350 [Xanthobacteraceae bacterium]|jgi:hypothetical protein